jgi:hypothetical protein
MMAVSQARLIAPTASNMMSFNILENRFRNILT